MWIMIAGPYKSGTDNPETWKENLRILNEYAYRVFEKGHIPVIGVNMALPIISAAGDDRYDEIMMPVSLALSDRCDAILKIGGASKGADNEVELFRRKGLPVFFDIEEIR